MNIKRDNIFPDTSSFFAIKQTDRSLTSRNVLKGLGGFV
jgi:hypothetical protein